MDRKRGEFIDIVEDFFLKISQISRSNKEQRSGMNNYHLKVTFAWIKIFEGLRIRILRKSIIEAVIEDGLNMLIPNLFWVSNDTMCVCMDVYTLNATIFASQTTK